MMRYALPGIGNNWMVMLKATALVSIIGLADLVKAAQDAGKSSYQLFYFLVTRSVDLPADHQCFELHSALARTSLRRRYPGGRTMIELLQEYWRAFLYSDGQNITGLAMTMWLLSASIFSVSSSRSRCRSPGFRRTFTFAGRCSSTPTCSVVHRSISSC
jgi:hypothetical protein